MLAISETFKGSAEAGFGVTGYSRNLSSLPDPHMPAGVPETFDRGASDAHSMMDAFVDKMMGGFQGDQHGGQAERPEPQQQDIAEAAAMLGPALGRQTTWKPMEQLNNNRIARTDIGQKQDTAAAMTADAQKGLQTLAEAKAEMAKVMTAHKAGETSPDIEDQASPTGLMGFGRGMAFQAGAVSLAGVFVGPPAAAWLGGVFIAKDAMTAAGKGFSAARSMGQGSFGAPEESARTATLSRAEAKEYKESGYLAQKSSPEPTANQASQPVMTPTRDVFDSGRIENSEAGLAGISKLPLEQSPQMQEMNATIRQLETRLTAQYEYGEDFEDSLEARERNGIALADGNNYNDAVNAGLKIDPGMQRLPGDIA